MIKNGDIIIDVSQHQAVINWDAVKASGRVAGVIIRCGYGSDYTNQDDYYFLRNVKECQRVGIPIVGIYLYAYAKSIDMAHSEAKHTIRLLQKSGLSQKTIVFYDVEDNSVVSVARLIWLEFYSKIKDSGYPCGLYTGAYYYRSYMSGAHTGDILWVAAYGNNDAILDEWARPNFGKTYALWQYSSAVKYSGIRNGQAGVDTSIVTDASVINKLIGNTVATTTTTTTAKQTSTAKANTLVRDGQIHSNNFTGVKIVVDGIVGAQTKAQKARVLQHAMNLDYKCGIPEDGDFGTISKKYLGNHYVKRGDKSYMVTALEILLMLNGYDPHGVECPGIFGSLEDTVKQFQRDKKLTVDGIAGRNTFLKLI